MTPHQRAFFLLFFFLLLLGRRGVVIVSVRPEITIKPTVYAAGV